MKKHLLTIGICALLIGAFGQKTIDKNLIYGHWKAFYFSANGSVVNSDSLEKYKALVENFKAMGKKAAESKAPQKKETNRYKQMEDSVKLIIKMTTLCKRIDSSYFEFSKNNTYSSVVYFIGNSEKPQITKGTFKWLGTDKLELTGGNEVAILHVTTLTDKILAFTGGEGKPSEETHVRFKKKE